MIRAFGSVRFHDDGGCSMLEQPAPNDGIFLIEIKAAGELAIHIDNYVVLSAPQTIALGEYVSALQEAR